MVDIDERDREIIAERVTALDERVGPRVGDFVEFPDDVTRRISHDWGDEVQTSDGGSWYLGKGYTSFSGGLFGVTPKTDLVLTGETCEGSVWIFHHDSRRAHNGVDTTIPFRVYQCSEEAPR